MTIEDIGQIERLRTQLEKMRVQLLEDWRAAEDPMHDEGLLDRAERFHMLCGDYRELLDEMGER